MEKKGATVGFTVIGIIFAVAFGVMIIMNPVYAVETSEPEIGLKVGQWVKYKPTLRVDGDGDMKKILESINRATEDQDTKIRGYNIDDAEWVKYTVADISGTTVTFDRIVKMTGGSEVKLESSQFDLTEFDPVTFYVMPTNLEFGSKFHDDVLGDIVFYKIGEWLYFDGIKVNQFNSKNIFSETWRPNVVEYVMEYEITSEFNYDKKTGIALSIYKDIMITNTNTHDSGWYTVEVTAIDYSEDVKPVQQQKRAVNDRTAILEKLSEYFVEVAGSEFIITNESVSLTDPKITTYDIIRVKDGTDLGVLKLYGGDRISSVSASAIYSMEEKTVLLADRVVYNIMSRLTDHPYSESLFTVLDENKDAGEFHANKTYDDVNVSFDWIETSSVFGTGIITEKITYLNESVDKPSQTTTQSAESSDRNVVDEWTKAIKSQTITQSAESSDPQPETNTSSKGGGCLIATAAFGSELAPQVQQLRELRDNKLLHTESGKSFMSSFNDFYYSFSPTVADWEREYPAFKEMVRIGITPMLSSLSILSAADSEQEILGYGIGIILLNVGMYFVAPVVVISKIRSRLLQEEDNA